MLNITISIGEIEAELTTDSDLSFDAIETLLNRAVASTLQMFLALPKNDRLASLGLETEDEFDDEELDNE